MRAVCLIVLVFAASCGGDDDCCTEFHDAGVRRDAPLSDASVDARPDARPDASVSQGVCNPLTQAGCAFGEKCTWLLDALAPQYVGHVGCAPDGNALAGDACMFGAPGATGFDNCRKGLVCGNYRGGTGTCKVICDQQGGAPQCASTHTCVSYTGLFSTGSTTPAAGGVCDQSCDPLADNDFDGSGTMSAKTGTVCVGPTVGCYGYPSYGTPPVTGWSCTNDINVDEAQPVGLRHRVACTEANSCADPGPQVFVNSCNQGYLPLLFEQTASTTIICVAMCKPMNCWTGNCGVGNPPANRDGAAPHECKLSSRVGTFASTEHCQFLWYREVDSNGQFLPSPTSDILGFCFDMAKYRYDSNGDNLVNNADLPLPNCDQLQDGFGSGSDKSMPLTYFGAADLGCVDSTHIPAMANGKQRALRGHEVLPFRPLYRRMLAP